MTGERAPGSEEEPGARTPVSINDRRASMPGASTPGDLRLITPETAPSIQTKSNTTAIATRYDKLVRNFLPALQLVAAIIPN
jgi:hypothetical protein